LSAFFPQLVAGPIVRAIDSPPQMARLGKLADVAWRPLLLLFLGGYVEKAVSSDNFAPYVDAFFGAPSAYDAGSHLLGILLYAAQIYCDFSGYSDMAIATAGLLGYKLGQNFDHPYAATSPRDFRRRWHMSLSTWLR
jgi:D-alanyl-lipoteichoic acid acyltransferase DltB (MBOAT superfamily)